MRKIFTLIVLLSTLLLGSSCSKKEIPDNFEFSFTWGCYGVSSYDSETGLLIKTNDATKPELYQTTHILTEQEKEEIKEIIRKLDIDKYPDEYNPNPLKGSNPSMTLIITLKYDEYEKTITAKDIALDFTSLSFKGNRFLGTCKTLIKFFQETEEWKALPDYEFYYD